MTRGLCRISIVGNLGRDPELRQTQHGTPCCTFAVAVNRRRRGPDGRPIDECTWFPVVAWQRLAEIAHGHLRRGSRVFIEGWVHARRYPDRAGGEHTAYEVVARDLVLLDGRAAVADPEELVEEFDAALPF